MPGRVDMARHAAGGLAMGIGIAMIPGGNDALILYGLPSLSPHAVPATLGVLAGAALALAVMRSAGGSVPVVVCKSDICESG